MVYSSTRETHQFPPKRTPNSPPLWATSVVGTSGRWVLSARSQEPGPILGGPARLQLRPGAALLPGHRAAPWAEFRKTDGSPESHGTRLGTNKKERARARQGRALVKECRKRRKLGESGWVGTLSKGCFIGSKLVLFYKSWNLRSGWWTETPCMMSTPKGSRLKFIPKRIQSRTFRLPRAFFEWLGAFLA